SARISSGPTNCKPSSPASMPSPPSTRRASSTAPSTSTSSPLRFSTSTSITSPRSAPARGSGLLGVPLVRLDDALHELVPHDVLVPEAHERDAVHRAEDVLHLNQ